jgi:hypothetical protein
MVTGGRRRRLLPARCPDLTCSSVFSSDAAKTWRYELRRVWDPTRGLVAFIGLNPSTADETHDDPTVRRCIGFARCWDFGGLIMLNAFAFQSVFARHR